MRIDAHHDDAWADEIVLTGTRPLRLVIRERYKTSGLSGDEWRFSYLWQVWGSDEWIDFDGPYSWQNAAIAAFYPAFRRSHPAWHDETCRSIQFLWKGQPLAEMTDDGESLPLLHALGSLAWAKITARQDLPWEKNYDVVCCQPGCRDAPVSTFRKLQDFYDRIGVPSEHYDGKSYRRFCARHLRRGDCGLDDADRNYELVEGPGVENHEPDPQSVSLSSFGGVLKL